ncbi:hypothetical protein HK100_008222 [Physocladia obscura]|uniref:Uncharacterized protein n=1 Tax=Physocladia obscura TaxID=109957 RepID=A0AAD5SQK8_9FUNG|nr:hypothetical protein HK100_008222 [Physocladia obscura]
MRPLPGTLEKPSEEILTSSTTGTLVMTRKEVIWSTASLDFTNPSGFSYDRSSAFRIRHSAITRFSAVELKKMLAAVPVVSGKQMGMLHRNTAATIVVGSGSISGGSGNGSGSVGLNSANSMMNLSASAAGSRQASVVQSLIEKSADIISGLVRGEEANTKAAEETKKAYSIVIHTLNEAFKFYPFYGEEVAQMLQALMAVTGMAPFRSYEFVQSVLTKRVELTRRHALRQLLQEENPWIENSVDLNRIIDALTSDTKPQLIVDMERLFHSCKIESEVTKEATNLLRKAWYHTQSDSSRLKVLSVIDRILDRVIMRQEDTVFTTMFKWLKHLEETINPYRNAEMLKLVMYLVKRAKMIQIEPLAPLPQDQCEAMFDHYEEYMKLQQFTDTFGVKLHALND